MPKIWRIEEAERLEEMLREERPYKEIAERLGKTERAVKEKAYRLKKTQKSSKDYIKPLYKGRGSTPEENAHIPQRLIEIEWEAIEELLNIAREEEPAKKAFYYQTLIGHIRTLATLLKSHSEPEETQDLAKLLEEIQKRAKRIIRRATILKRTLHLTKR